jgi:hypothetical protein
MASEIDGGNENAFRPKWAPENMPTASGGKVIGKLRKRMKPLETFCGPSFAARSKRVGARSCVPGAPLGIGLPPLREMLEPARDTHISPKYI